jgi:hypothetical protein
MIRSKRCNHASIHVSFLSVTPKYNFKRHGKISAGKEQQILSWKAARKVLDLIFCPLDALVKIGKLLLCADSSIWRCYFVIFALTADYVENVYSHSVKKPHCLVCQALTSLFGEGNSSWWQLRDYRLYFKKVILAMQGDKTERGEAKQYL